MWVGIPILTNPGVAAYPSHWLRKHNAKALPEDVIIKRRYATQGFFTGFFQGINPLATVAPSLRDSKNELLRSARVCARRGSAGLSHYIATRFKK